MGCSSSVHEPKGSTCVLWKESRTSNNRVEWSIDSIESFERQLSFHSMSQMDPRAPHLEPTRKTHEEHLRRLDRFLLKLDEKDGKLREAVIQKKIEHATHLV